jgi:hypothetical protein
MRRWARTVIVFLLIGSVVNVAVAWVCALDTSAESDERWLDQASQLPWLRRIEANFGLRLGEMSAYKGSVMRIITIRGRAVAPHAPTEHGVLQACEAGWPMLSLAGCKLAWLRPESRNDVQVARYFGAFGVSETNVRIFENSAGVLPVQPIWRGFAINTVLYAATAWLVIAGPFALRRVMRPRRGLCSECGYPRGSSAVCTECGAALAAKTEAC